MQASSCTETQNTETHLARGEGIFRIAPGLRSGRVDLLRDCINEALYLLPA